MNSLLPCPEAADLSSLTLSRTLTDPDGRPVGGVNVEVDGPICVTAQTSPAGRFEVAPAPPGLYRVRPDSPRWICEPEGLTLQVGEDADRATFIARPIPPFLGTAKLWLEDSWEGYGVAEGQFQGPIGVALDAGGNVFVGDMGNHRVQKFTRAGVFLTAWGSAGTERGQFLKPARVAVDARGTVYVADYSSNRIQKFTGDGKWLAEWGTRGTLAGEFEGPFGLAVDAAGDVYVSEYNGRRIQRFTSSGVPVTLWSVLDDEGKPAIVSDLAVDREGHVYASLIGAKQIQQFTDRGRLLATWAVHHSVKGLAVDAAGLVYACHHGLEIFSPTGRRLREWRIAGEQIFRDQELSGMAVDPQGRLVVVSESGHRVNRFQAALLLTGLIRDASARGMSGVTLIVNHRDTGVRTSWDGSFTVPVTPGIPFTLKPGYASCQWSPSHVFGSGDTVVPPECRFAVQHYVQRFTVRGSVVGPTGAGLPAVRLEFNGPVTLTTRSAADGTFGFPPAPAGLYQVTLSSDHFRIAFPNRPVVLTVDRMLDPFHGHPAEVGLGEIPAFEPAGGWGGRGTKPGQLESPMAVGVDRHGRVYVADTGNHRIQAFDAAGKFLTLWGGPGTANGLLNGPEGLVINNRTGSLYVADTHNKRIQIFSLDGAFRKNVGLMGFLGPYALAQDGDGVGYFSMGVEPEGPGERKSYASHIMLLTNRDRQNFQPSGWGPRGRGPGELREPRGIAVGTDGNIFVVDQDNDKVQVFTLDGQPVGAWGSPGTAAGEFNHPTGIALSSSGDVFVADTGNHRIQMFSSAGGWAGTWGRQGAGEGEVNSPKGIALGPEGRLYVADTGNHRITVYRRSR